ncbi:MAG: SMP-30/gluconolactonase/LRE family protein, partial [Alphaproteobacteria bacterium]|nr:SMP-30/gluconolactonase/LRE family protein [Alphaproteobacteria bacterium]
MSIREVASGLKFPEGPVAMDDGSVIVVEIQAKKITRVKPDGKKQTIAVCEGGPNGAAIGPDGALYVCNNGENFEYHRRQ